MSCRNSVFTAADRDLAATVFARIAAETAGSHGGVCRPSYGVNETVAWLIVEEIAGAVGLHAQADAVGNLVIARDATVPQGRAIWIGSHLDSVPSGGNYDGLAGVVAALLVAAKARDLCVDVPLVAIGLRGEESAWFGVPYLGSKAILGKLRPGDLDRRRRADPTEDPAVEGCPTLRECLSRIGVSADEIAGKAHVTIDQVAEFWELHIEQGPILAARGKSVGVVTGIRGNARAPNARITGRAGHSGTTPHDLREDAVARFAAVMTKLEARRQTLAEFGDDLVFTCGTVTTDPAKHSITTIADEIRFSLDVRSLQHHHAVQFLSYAEGLGVQLGEVVETPGAKVNPAMWQRAARACADLGVDYEVMPSGAGHDAAIFEQAGIPAGMVFVRNDRGSHNPDEAMDTDDFMTGCEVLWRAVTEGAR